MRASARKPRPLLQEATNKLRFDVTFQRFWEANYILIYALRLINYPVLDSPVRVKAARKRFGRERIRCRRSHAQIDIVTTATWAEYYAGNENRTRDLKKFCIFDDLARNLEPSTWTIFTMVTLPEQREGDFNKNMLSYYLLILPQRDPGRI